MTKVGSIAALTGPQRPAGAARDADGGLVGPAWWPERWLRVSVFTDLQSRFVMSSWSLAACAEGRPEPHRSPERRECVSAELFSAQPTSSASDSRQAATLGCRDCGAPALWAFTLRCEQCGGALEPAYDLAHAELADTNDPVRRYQDLLPISSTDLMDGVCVRTPCVRHAELGLRLGLPNLWLKCEFAQPTGSTKDRMAAVVLPVLRELGVTEFAVSSTGNSSTALARAVQIYGDIQGHFFAAPDFVERHTHFDHPGATLHIVEGDFVAAGQQAKAFAADKGITWEGGFFNWARREGLKLAYLEAFDQMPRTPDVVAQAISSGMGVVGAQKGVEEYQRLGRLSRQPRILMAQQETCAPMARGWASGRATLLPDDIVANPTGLAHAILRGDGTATYPYLFDVATRTGGDIVAVSAYDIVKAHQMLAEAGFDVCYASATCLAAVIQQRELGKIDRNETVLVNLTGRERTP